MSEEQPKYDPKEFQDCKIVGEDSPDHDCKTCKKSGCPGKNMRAVRVDQVIVYRDMSGRHLSVDEVITESRKKFDSCPDLADIPLEKRNRLLNQLSQDAMMAVVDQMRANRHMMALFLIGYDEIVDGISPPMRRMLHVSREYVHDLLSSTLLYEQRFLDEHARADAEEKLESNRKRLEAFPVFAEGTRLRADKCTCGMTDQIEMARDQCRCGIVEAHKHCRACGCWTVIGG